MRTCFIYALCEPGTRRVRYIGKTVDLKRRFREHLRQSLKLETYLGHWLLSLAGEPPNLIVLRGVPESEGSAAEIKYIRIAQESLGMLLVNLSDGGESPMAGKKHSPGTRLQMRVAKQGVKKSAEHCANIKASKMGEKNPMFGKRHSDARKAQSGLRGDKNPQFGKVRSPEHCARLKAAAIARYSR